MARISVLVLTGLSSAVAVMDVGTSHVCATIGSSAKCWGDNKWGQLGREDNSTMIGDDPDETGDNLVAVPLDGAVSQMALGESHTCMMVDAGLVCFGKNDAGQLGLGDTENRGMSVGDIGETVDFGTGLSAVAVTTGCDHTCALLDDDSVKCFGENNYGQLGQGSTDNVGDDAGEMGDALAAVALDGAVTAVAAGCDSTCALMEDGAVMCWGRNRFGQLGTLDSDDRLDGNGLDLVAVDLDGDVATAIAAGDSHVCVLLSDDTVKCWGLNTSGQLGQGEDLSQRGDEPGTLGANLSAIVLGTGDVPTAVDCGSFHTCVLLDDATVKCFGENGNGELGIGTEDDVGLLPDDMGDNLAAASVTGVEDVAAGGSTTCVVGSGDSVTCWGLGSSGQLGQGSDESILDPAEVEPVDLGTDTSGLTPAPTAVLPSAVPSAAPTAVDASAAPTAVDASAAPSASSRQVTLAPLGLGETFSPTPTPTSEVGAEGSSSAPARFNAGVLTTLVLGAVGSMAALIV